ncbi:DUF418 domain-containing protein [Rhodococcus maanshanensis]|uniref:DUF418 domain-containing protein n=1 Tax=Rhodococcus maanshanensis TaxID=183556 RepID=UPI0022B36FFE|nr:DUF418 domain-containing protein [Rhodococcus maanshanensis]MCZ4555895.1 DUF418 domain-containing protein [Rhodococcus maanshanensis]
MSLRTGTVSAPVAPDRLRNVDALRGFALFGILAVNIWAFADPYYASPESNPAFDSGLDHVVRFTVSLLFETKFYLLFSFLFGYSFTLQMAAAERAGTAFLPRMLRRQSGLLAIGLVHGAVLYYGEILSTYAILGLILLACRRISPRRAVQIGVGLVAAVGVVWMLLGLLTLAEGGGEGVAASDAAVKLTAFGGDAAATLGFHSGHLPETISALVALQAPSAMAMFFFGFAAGRVQAFADPDRFRPLMRRILVFGLPVGLIGALAYALAAAYAPGGGVETFAFGLGQLTAPMLTASYVVAGVMLFRTAPGRRIESALAPMGTIALTNYLLQSLVLGVLFTGYGFGLIDRMPPLAVLTAVPAIFATQLVLSRWWLRGHRYGPAEWALRAITIAGIPPWRRRG